MKIPALVMAAVLGCGASAFAADTHDSSTNGSAKASTHQLAADFKGAMHKLGQATRHALHRADAAMHHMAHRDKKTA